MAKDMQKSSDSLADVLNVHIADAGMRQRVAYGSAPEKKPRTWEEIEAYAEWIASTRVRGELLKI